MRATFTHFYCEPRRAANIVPLRKNVSHFPREIIEGALAHVIGDKAEQAYRRSDALDKRQKLMDAWAAYCEPRRAANIVPLRKSS
jgi:hypothetical protein